MTRSNLSNVGYISSSAHCCIHADLGISPRVSSILRFENNRNCFSLTHCSISYQGYFCYQFYSQIEFIQKVVLRRCKSVTHERLPSIHDSAEVPCGDRRAWNPNKSCRVYNARISFGLNKNLNIRIPRSNCQILDESLLISFFTF
jgi:hypothetical protein